LYAGTSDLQEIDNVSVKEYITETNTPRLDYSTGAEAFLLEPQRTNLLQYSNSFSQSYWQKVQSNVTSNQEVSPDGSSNADLVVGTVQSATGTYIRIASTSANTIGSTYTLSTYVKPKGTSQFFKFWARNTDANQVVFDLVNLTTTQPSTSTIKDVGNGWIRVTTTGELLSATVYPYFYTYYAASEADGFYFYGAQLEEGSYATSYIPTSGTTVTRNQELCVDATPVINSEEGVLYAEIAALSDDGTLRNISISDGTYSNTILLRYLDLSNKIQAVVRIGNSFKGICVFTLADTTENIKVAYKWKNGDFALWINGTEVDTSFDIGEFAPNILTELSFDRGDGTQNFFGNTKGLKIYPKALADVELQDLTTI